MANKYQPLTVLLSAARARGQSIIEVDFDAIASAVGGLPLSSDVRQWWANSGQVQALAWRAAGFHVDHVSLDHKRVRFALGERGGRHGTHDRAAAHRKAVGEPVDARVRLQWLDAGTVVLDGSSKPVFPGLEAAPGVYRMTFTGGIPDQRPRIYIGESANLQRRLAVNYRHPGPSQLTNLRINALLRRHLSAGGTVALAVATTAGLWVDRTEHPLDLNRKNSRLLAESAALVAAHISDHADIENLE